MLSTLIAVVIISGISGALAALLVVAERYIANYGECTITINDEKELTVEGGRPLLESLAENKIFIPSACGGRGTCAYCKVKILEGGGPVGPTEKPLLEPGELEDNVRISCQVKVRENLKIEIPDELFNVKEFRGKVAQIRDLTHDMKELRIELIEPETIDFVPGQYIQLVAPAYGTNPEPVYRAYSVSSPPSDNHAIELIIRLVPGGICTTWVFEQLNEGDEVKFNGPYGQFRLSDTDQEMVWIAGGSGMAPFWSIIRHMAEHDIQRKCTYLFGALSKQDLFLVDELREMEDKLPNFTFIPALSKPAPEDDWDGETGLITEVAEKHIPDGSEAEAYLCGSGGMINAACEVLEKKGITADRRFYDSFT
jgi:Na+-transporting NADH:ubiquinone oxidoreductase subunit F